MWKQLDVHSGFQRKSYKTRSQSSFLEKNKKVGRRGSNKQTPSLVGKKLVHRA